MAELSGSVPRSSPGLPRGRTSLPPIEVITDQRRRLHRAVTDAVAEKGYSACTIADIVERARVSRSVLYRSYDGKLACFLAAIESGGALLHARLSEVIESPEPDSLSGAIDAILARYLAICAAEPAYTRAWVVELAAAGDPGMDVRTAMLDRLAGLFRSIDERWGVGAGRPPMVYVTLVGGVAEVVSRQVRAGRIDQLGELHPLLHPTITDLLTTA